MKQERLFRLTPDALTVSALWSWPDGWTLTVWSHASGELRSESEPARYERLTTEELLDVLCVEAATRLQVP